jgi:hypothetical protein
VQRHLSHHPLASNYLQGCDITLTCTSQFSTFLFDFTAPTPRRPLWIVPGCVGTIPQNYAVPLTSRIHSLIQYLDPSHVKAAPKFVQAESQILTTTSKALRTYLKI